MLKRFCIWLIVLFLIPITAYGNEITISASSCVVIDSSSNSVLYSKNMSEPRSMASTTKIMTCLLACESNIGDKIITITDEMLNGTFGTLIYLKAGDEISFNDLIKGAMLASGNDSANALAVVLGGSVEEFVELMNKRADEIGMKNTFFETPSGLDEGNHHSTAYDMALLASVALENERFSSICKLKSTEICINGHKQTIYNHNKLLSYDDSCVGVKTGFTEKAGRCLVSAYEYKGNKIIIVTLNAPNDWEDHQKLFKYAKSKYKKRNITKSYSIDCVGGTNQVVDCKAKCKIYSLNEIETKAYYYPFIYAPIMKNDVVGKLEIYDNDMLVKTVDIIVEEDIKLWQTMK